MRQGLGSFVSGLTQKAKDTIAMSKPQKTIDARYTAAKCKYYRFRDLPDQAAGHTLQWKARLQQLSDLLLAFSADVQSFYTDAPPEHLAHPAAFSDFTRSFSDLTNHDFASSIDPDVFAPVMAWKDDLTRLEGIKKERSAARKAYDAHKAKLEVLRSKSGASNPEISAEAKTNDQLRGEYERLNSDFIGSIDKLTAEKSQSLGQSYGALIGAMSHYFTTISGDLEKLHGVFPE
jgi:hypothetical protein